METRSSVPASQVDAPRARPLRRLAALAIAIGIAACARRLPPRATPLDAERMNVSVDELEHGRSLLISKCGNRCHKAPMPTDKTADEWPKALDEMAPRAALEGPDRQAIEQYLRAMARR